MAPHRSVDLEYIRSRGDLFPGVFVALDKMGLLPFLHFNKAYNEELSMLFYATVYFATGSDHAFIW